ncbi:MAG: AbrB/MazE/SpoVT family DNA-binding domain-containing protein [Alphaproteobacteria bacterium]|nr:AbrB/MazE/SpoVT family DNA-binding domain-containing protein [Alphaproteobacteria bacterium]
MKAHIVQIGHSKGIRIPKTLIEQCGFGDIVNIQVQDHSIILTPYKKRENWAKAFEEMAQKKDDTLLDIDNIQSSFDKDEWEWS